MTETATNYNVDAIASELTELEQLNLKVAAIAGWTDIEVWQLERNLPIRTFQGENKAHPELGKFVPKYVESIDAIVKVFALHDINWTVNSYACAFTIAPYAETLGDTPAIALCKLLLELNPKPETKPEVIEATFG